MIRACSGWSGRQNPTPAGAREARMQPMRREEARNQPRRCKQARIQARRCREARIQARRRSLQTIETRRKLLGGSFFGTLDLASSAPGAVLEASGVARRRGGVRKVTPLRGVTFGGILWE